MDKTALVVGATGVVGREPVRELCDSPGYDEVEAWTRREIGFCHPKLHVRIIDFEGISDIAPHKFDEIFCTLGTTMKQAGSHEAFFARGRGLRLCGGEVGQSSGRAALRTRIISGRERGLAKLLSARQRTYRAARERAWL